MTEALDIRARAPRPAGALSNFAPHAFEIDGVACASMEGFLQSLKFSDPNEQRRICSLKAHHARSVGRRRKWQEAGALWWQGVEIDRLADDYQRLLDRAYEALFAQSQDFRDALAATGDAPLTHSLGRQDPTQTILTAEEFCARLERLRAPTQTPS